MKFAANSRLASAILASSILLVSAHGIWQTAAKPSGLDYIDQDYNSKSWRSLIAANMVPYHKLTEADFAVNDSVESSSMVMTISFITYEYQYRVVENGRNSMKAQVTSFKVRSGLNRNQSWRRSSFKDANVYLEHEQGHADINEIEARAFATKVAETKPEGPGTTRDQALKALDEKFTALYNEMAAENRRLQIAYDNATNTGLNAKSQAKETVALTVKLKESGIADTWTGRTIHSNATRGEVIF